MNKYMGNRMNNSPESVSELRWIRILLTIIAIPVVVVMLKTMASIFIPLIFAVFISFIFAPLRAWLAKRKVPLGAILLIMILMILLGFALIGGVVYAAVNSFIAQLPKYQERFNVLAGDLLTWFEQATAQMDLALANIPQLDAAALLSGSSFNLTKLVSGTMGTFVNAGGKIFITLIFLIFLISGGGALEKRLKKVLTAEKSRQTLDTVLGIQTQIQRYFFNKFLVSFCTAAVAMTVLWIFGIDFIIIAGILFVIMNFIPNFGSIISVSFALLLCLLQYGFGLRFAGLALCLGANELFFANIFEPRLMGQKLNLTPIMILISLIFWGYVWGIVGMMIAVPITSAVNIVLKQMNSKSLISAVISDT